MIYPTLPFKLWKRAGSNRYAEPVFAAMPDELCAPVRLSFSQTHTTVRTDSAASKGHAMEQVATVVILVKPGTQAGIDDKLEILGQPLRVIGWHPRFTVRGVLDHVELHCDAWT